MQFLNRASAGKWQRTFGLIALFVVALLTERYIGNERIADLSGRPQLVDGDSFRLNGENVRLVGIDAPEGRQMCKKDGRDWPCGNAARQHLQKLMSGGTITCRFEGRDKHQRLLGTCFNGEQNINQEMVASGFAVAFGQRYVKQESAARSAARGLWAGSFERPQDWRRKNFGSADAMG